ncbi:DEAD/DEAH box helicase [Kineococcus sp. R8]|nr:DEAD/DEAH box helicase [Kineococcus siccus]
MRQLDWRALRPIQVAAAAAVQSADQDVLIIAGTASGKTEAAWLPIFSRLLDQSHTALGTLSLSPLKALIDDQVLRLSDYAGRLDLQVEAWHGDVADTRKKRILREPPAAVLTTPESLQGLLLRRPLGLAQWLAPLQYVIIDEVHAFAGTDRGHQVQSLLTQLDAVVGRRVPRIALSATVSDEAAMCDFLRPGQGREVTVVRTPGASRLDLDVALYGYLERPPAIDTLTARHPTTELSTRDTARGERLDMARRIDADTRGRRSLVFASSRGAVEEMATLLADDEVTTSRRPERYFAHHGSLSAPVRRAAERAMREASDTTIVCTSTLELGVDLPHLDQVTQIDTCLSVASLRQRLGRSGREAGTRPALRLHVTESPVPDEAGQDELAPPRPLGTSARLRTNLLQNMASVHLVVEEGWVEPPDAEVLGLSTLVHQTLCLLASPAGATPKDLYELLCRRGPWRRVTPAAYGEVLRALAARAVVRQDAASGGLHLDEQGHDLVSKRDFLSVFTTSAEYSVRHDGKEIGTLPSRQPLGVDSTLALAGRTWKVTAIHPSGWKVDVVPYGKGLPRHFSGGGSGSVHRYVRETMRRLYQSSVVPTYLDEPAVALLQQGRQEFQRLQLAQRAVVAEGTGCFVALFTGDREQETIRRWLHLVAPGVSVLAEPAGLQVAEDVDVVELLLHRMVAEAPPEPLALATGVALRQVGRYDYLLPDDLLTAEYASRMIDVMGATAALSAALSIGSPQ